MIESDDGGGWLKDLQFYRDVIIEVPLTKFLCMPSHLLLNI